ncbi:hypothetical protein AVEN_245876-1 [Araneus ventricosus]|uniref:Uncharacterized protein n=1 Tax=Araneus ventricosus TaxID=182803 RepID=A0A4Y2HLZ7_ARAVE|nr:hypothetical protein AVEN_245876-1 [Araneus ventricosus]
MKVLENCIEGINSLEVSKTLHINEPQTIDRSPTDSLLPIDCKKRVKPSSQTMQSMDYCQGNAYESITKFSLELSERVPPSITSNISLRSKLFAPQTRSWNLNSDSARPTKCIFLLGVKSTVEARGGSWHTSNIEAFWIRRLTRKLVQLVSRKFSGGSCLKLWFLSDEGSCEN